MKRLAYALALSALVSVSGCALFEGDDDDDGTPDGGIGEMCSAANDCSPNLVCAGGTCQQEGSVGLGGDCWATRDCGAGLFCAPPQSPLSEAGLCAPAGEGDIGDSCATGAECQRGLVCQLFGFGGTCQESGGSDLGQSCDDLLDCIAGLACAADGTCKSPFDAYPPFTGVVCADDVAPFRVLFEVPRAADPPTEFFRLPFPNDILVDTSGSLSMTGFPEPGPSVLGVDLVTLYVDALERDFTGFSSVAVVTMRFSERLDFSTADANSVHFIDVTEGTPEFGSDRGRSWGYTTGRTLYNCRQRLTIRASTTNPLLPGHTYAVYVSTALRSEEGGTVAVQDDDFAAVVSDTRPADAEMGAAWDRYAPFRAYLLSETIAPSTIAGAAVFTVQDTTGRMEALAAAAATEAAPTVQDITLCDGTNVSPCDDGDARACGSVNANYHEIHGRIRIPTYQNGTPPFETADDGGDLNLPGGVATKVADEMVCFAMTIPKGVTEPGGGWPYVVFGHGTGGSPRSFINNDVAETLATANTPTAVIGFDGVVHGARANGSSRTADSLMFNVINPAAARDNHLQGAVDVLHMMRIHEAGAITVAGLPADVNLDGTRRYFFGHSQGSNVGIPALAVSNAAPAAIFSGAGAFLTVSLTSKTSPVDSAAGLKFLIDPDFDTGHPVMTVFQTFFDSTDTINFAPQLIRRPEVGVDSKHVLMTFGPGDTFSPPDSMKRMAQTAGLQHAPPVIEDISLTQISRPIGENLTGGDGVDRFGALFQYNPSGYDGHFVATRDASAVSDWTAFLMSLIETGTPNVP